jgi:hypothetical protein
MSRSLRCAEHVARTKERRGAYRVLVEKREKGGHLNYPGTDGRIILKWILERDGAWSGSILLRIGTGGGFL